MIDFSNDPFRLYACRQELWKQQAVPTKDNQVTQTVAFLFYEVKSLQLKVNEVNWKSLQASTGAENPEMTKEIEATITALKQKGKGLEEKIKKFVNHFQIGS